MDVVLKYRLLEKYSRLFLNADASVLVDCPRGWMNIIDNLCHNIQDYIDKQNKTGRYLQIIDVEEVNPEDLRTQTHITLIKGKHGKLELELEYSHDYVEGLVSMARALSQVTCENCSGLARPAQVRNETHIMCFSCKKSFEKK